MVRTIKNELVVGRKSLKRSIGRKNNGGVVILTGVTSDAYFTLQDGNGRIQNKWNATFGRNEKYLKSNEPAFFENIKVISDPYYSIKYAPAGISGQTIQWRDHFSIKSNGNVGLSQPNPSERLEVAGAVKCDKLICEEIVAPLPSLTGDNSAAIYQQSRDAVVSILVQNGTQFFLGTGFFVTSDGWIVTAGHNFVSGNVLDKMDKVFITVNNFNNTNMVRVIECQEFYVDGAGDIGVARVPGINGQKALQWGSASSSSIGDTVYVIGDPLGNDIQSVAKGVVRDNQFTDPGGAALLTNMLIDAPAFGGNSGSPIIDGSGKVVGIYTFGFIGTESFGGGPSQVIAEPVSKFMIDNGQDYTEKRYLGITWSVFDAFLATRLLTSFSNFDLRGIYIRSKEADSPLDGLLPGDVILEIDGTVLGNRTGQFSPNHITWLIQSSQSVSIRYIRPPSTSVNTVVVNLDRDFSDHQSSDGPLLGENNTENNQIKLLREQRRDK